MTSVEHVTLEVADPTAAKIFYTDVLGLGAWVRVRASQEPTTGFRGFTLSLILAQPANVNAIIDAALEAGATTIKPAEKSLFGYGGVVRAPDGTIVTVASSSKKDTGPATRRIDDVVIQLGVADVAAATGRVLIVDETRRSGGVGEGVLAALVDGAFVGSVRRVAAADAPVPLGPAAQQVLVGEDAITQGAHTLLAR
ncbi:transketolase C-terminal domain-containing protein [Patulibacter sp. NPDC049589]|uniref:transketolase C-terminal domain-containing protein n=1 Tax=Patulibacter sp. NPDC049589 TaxID=3154731 RepID=UPI00341C64AC